MNIEIINNMCLCKKDPHTIPLFMYFRLDSARAFLDAHTLKMTDPTRCNDPYECNYQLIFNAQMCPDGDEFRHWINTQLQQYSIACFSTQYDSIPMWAYYAENQKGICVEFIPQNDPIAFTNLQYVSYKKQMYCIKERWQDSDIQHILTTKADVWEHEKEVRLLRENVPYRLLTIAPQSITSIIFGCNLQHFYDDTDDVRRKESIIQIIDILNRPEYAHVVIKQIVQDEVNYNLTPEIIHCIVWQEGNKLVVTSLANQLLTIKQVGNQKETICYSAHALKWEKVVLTLRTGLYYIESDQMKRYLRFSFE